MRSTREIFDGTDQMRLRLCLLVALMAAAPAHATTVTYDLVGVTAGFTFDVSQATPNYPVILTFDGTVTADPDAYAIIGINFTVSGAPSFLASWNATYPTIVADWGPTVFAVNDAGNNGLEFSLGNLSDPSVSFVLQEIWTQQWGEQPPVYTTGYAKMETPLPTTLPLLGAGLFGLALLRCRRALTG